MHPLVNTAISAARDAGEIINRYAQQLDRLKVREKSNNELVSEVDLKAEQAIIYCLKKAYPSHAIMAEESGFSASGSESESDEYTWIIDPLDGTTNFIHGFPHYCVSIALKYKSRVEHAVIFDPVRKECFSASRGAGAQLNGVRIRVSKESNIDKALLGTGFPFRNKKYTDEYFETFKALFRQSACVRRAGAVALDLAYIACGRLEGFWDFGLKPWDIAAGSLLVKEAGGLVSNCQGEENFLDSGNIIAANPKIFKPILQALKGVQPF
jgi:myo-inositol-1(or 4)-monophosphatase